MRVSVGRALITTIVAMAASMPVARADDVPVPEQIVNGMNKVWGSHPGARANHAKGIVTEGSFTPTPAAKALSKAPLFAGPAVPITARLSDATGVPNLPDGSAYASPHGIAIKFHFADGSDMDMVTNSLKFFPVATGEDFRDLFLAIAASGPDSPHPNALEQFVAKHPAVATSAATVATPTSLARENYFGIDAFVFVDAAGKRQPFRFQIMPDAGVAHMTQAEADKQAPDFLMRELPARLAKAPVTFHLMAQLANPGDPTNNATQAWPDDRKTVDLGTLTLTSAVPDSAAAERTLIFLPGNVPDGIEASDDPLIDMRTQAYAVSFGRRQE